MEFASRREITRRGFVASGLAGGGAWAAASALGRTSVVAGEPAPLATGAVVLFQGDSITDAGRDRKTLGPNESGALGRGYAWLLAAGLLADHAKLQLKIFNRGISGNKIPDLSQRWPEETLALKPSLLSILIGVNDLWHKLNGRYRGTVADYETGYRQLLQQTVQALPTTRLVICEPFVLRCGAINDQWFPEFDQRRAVAQQLASEFQATFVPFQSMFDEAVQQAPPAYWAADGVHPTMAGHALMAKTWRSIVHV